MRTKENDLPAGWALAKIGDLIPKEGLFVDGDWVESKDQDPDGDVRLIQLADIGDGTFIDKSARFLTTDKAVELNCTFLKKGDLLIARMPEPLGRCCIFPLPGEEQFVTVVDVCAVRLSDTSANPKYIMHLINSPHTRTKIGALQSGSTRKRISPKNLATIKLPIPPRNEQDRIVSKIEELFSELDKGIESLKTARDELKVYRQSVLKYSFEGRLTAQWRKENKEKLETADQLLERIKREREARYRQQLEDWTAAIQDWETEGKQGKKPSKPRAPSTITLIADEIVERLPRLPEGWAWFRLGHIAEISGGLTKNQKRNSLPRKMRYLRVANVYADSVLADDIYEIGVTEEEARKVKLQSGDLLIVEGNGSIDQIGRVAVWADEVPECGHQNHLIRARLEANADPRFLLNFLLSPLGRDLIIEEASSTSGLHTLSISKVSNLIVPVASAGEEIAVLSQIGEKLSKVDGVLKEIEVELARSEALRQSILRKAFSGQLVAQDPNDEPATVLLARIRGEREEGISSNKNSNNIGKDAA